MHPILCRHFSFEASNSAASQVPERAKENTATMFILINKPRPHDVYWSFPLA